jgi:hypothetical protein
VSSIADRYGNALSGVAVAIVFVGFAVWLAPIIGVSYFQISLVFLAFAVAYLAGIASERLKGSEWRVAVWAGHLCAGISIIICLGLIVGSLILVVWAKFYAPASHCMRCD